MSVGAVSILIFTGFALFIISILVRVKTGGKYEIKMIDLTLVLIPLLLWLIVTGKIQKFAVGGVEFETAQAFIGATEAPIELQVAMTLPLGIEQVVETVERDAKAGVSQIPRLIRKKTEALEFRLGHGGYWGPAIQKYFESLDANAFLRYAIIYYQDGTLFGVFDAKELLRYFREKGGILIIVSQDISTIPMMTLSRCLRSCRDLFPGNTLLIRVPTSDPYWRIWKG